MQAHTFRDWRREHRGMAFFGFEPRYRDVYPIWQPRAWVCYGWLYQLAWYAYRRFIAPINVVRIPTLPPTWTDADSRVLHGLFAILVDVVEKEDIFNHNAYWEDWKDGLQEIAQLYDWWKNKRPLRQDPTDWWVAQCAKEGLDKAFHYEHDAPPAPEDGEPKVIGLISRKVWRSSEAEARHRELLLQSSDMERQQEAEDDEMLHRLIDIRGYLWT